MIKVWDYLKELEKEKADVMAAIEKVLDSGWLVLGENVKNFESEFSKYISTTYGVGVNSGTDAIFLGLKAIGIGQGDEVLTVANTAVPTVSAIQATGARPVFVDINRDDYLIDVDQIEDAITRNTKAILPVHLFGQSVKMDQLLEVARKHNLRVLEDCAQSHGAEYRGKKTGSFGDVSAFSFYPTKILGTFGDGGIALTSNETIDQSLRKLRFYGMEGSYYSVERGYNSRLDEIHAAILLYKLKNLEKYIERRREIASVYNSELKGTSLILPVERGDGKHAYYLYVVRHPDRDKIIKKLAEKDIKLNVSYPWPIHTMPICADYGYKDGDLPQTEKAAKEIFSLPMYPSLTLQEQQEVILALQEALNE